MLWSLQFSAPDTLKSWPFTNRAVGIIENMKLMKKLISKCGEIAFKTSGGNESISLSSSKSYMRGEIGYVTGVNFVRK